MNCKKSGEPLSDNGNICPVSGADNGDARQAEAVSENADGNGGGAEDSEVPAYGCGEGEDSGGKADAARIRITCVFAAILLIIFSLMFGKNYILFMFSPNSYCGSVLMNTYSKISDDYYNQKRAIPKLSGRHLDEYTVSASAAYDEGTTLSLRYAKSDKDKEFFGKISCSDGENSVKSSFFLNDSNLGVKLEPYSEDYLTLPAVITAEELRESALSDYLHIDDTAEDIDISYSTLSKRKANLFGKSKSKIVSRAGEFAKSLKCKSKGSVLYFIDGKTVKAKKLTFICEGEKLKEFIGGAYEDVTNDERTLENFGAFIDRLPEGIADGLDFGEVTLVLYTYKETAVGAEAVIPFELDGRETELDFSIKCVKTDNRILNSKINVSLTGAMDTDVKLVTSADYAAGVYKYAASAAVNGADGRFDIAWNLNYDKNNGDIRGYAKAEDNAVSFNGTLTKDEDISLDLPVVTVKNADEYRDWRFSLNVAPGMKIRRDRNAGQRSVLDMSGEELKTALGVLKLKDLF